MKRFVFDTPTSPTLLTSYLVSVRSYFSFQSYTLSSTFRVFHPDARPPCGEGDGAPSRLPRDSLLALRAAHLALASISLAAVRSATTVTSQQPAAGGASREPTALPPNTRYTNQRD
ncbi:hypothetical protein DFH09DRAFT_1318135 [Mycena vulgaris]|nr:hypothetical protein DFH09DRAFT_1318135 [Mycena vulgaris]